MKKINLFQSLDNQTTTKIIQTKPQLKEKTRDIFQANKSFSQFGLNSDIVNALKNMGYQSPTNIQAKALPPGLAGRDLLCLSETGSGKTLSFILPIINELYGSQKADEKVLILSPTRQLCLQIKEYFERLESLGIGGWGSIAIYGGVDPMKQVIQLSKKPSVIVGTPGRILHHLEHTKGFNLDNLKYLVLDEADKLLNMDFEKQINDILEKIPKQRHTYLYSATLTSKVNKLQRVSLNNPITIEINQKYKTVDQLEEFYIFIPSKWKDCYLIYTLLKQNAKKTIVFMKTCLGAQRVAMILKQLKFSAMSVHGDLSQSQRLQGLNKFKNNEVSILVCTDVISRGIDIHQVNLVINYDICSAKDYIHRVGRTARIGLAGKAITIVTQYDVQMFQKIQQKLSKKIPQYQTVQKDALLFLQKLQLIHQQVNRKLKRQNT